MKKKKPTDALLGRRDSARLLGGSDLDNAMLGRRRDAARILGVSESQILKFEREGLLHPIRVPGIRAIRFAMQEVRALAAKWIDQEKESA